MYKDRTFFIIALLCFMAFSCSKDKPAVIITPEPTDEYSQYGTPFGEVPATEDVIMYEVNLRAFSPTGDLAGVVNRLDNLKNLGVNVIWLMPIHPIGQVNSVNSPYSVKDYKAISSEYGTLSDLRMLTDEAHARGMAVIMDWVANHTAWDNSWISNKSWYTQNTSGEIVIPAGTNWQDVADLNFENSSMREAMIDVMKYWVLEANIDGYRCDYADGVPFDFWKTAIDSLKSIPNRDYVLLAEGGRLDHWEAGFDLIYAWDFYGALKSVYEGQPAFRIFNVHQIEYGGIPSGKHKLRYSTNHDESAWDQTPMILFNGKEGATAASVVTIFMGGVPMIYTGQEVGRTSNVPFFSNSAINWNDNPDMLNAYEELLNFYNGSSVSKTGSITNYSNTDIVCFKKKLNEEELLVIVNMREEQLDFPIPTNLQNTSWTDALTGEVIAISNNLSLSGYEYYVLKK
ncbi:alpha-amylase family glycosyl hydrolase [Lewinella sp. LCG006]|uniref:alpha-amylase family glycosyl hydrolase n=1 Tax=Lewinella sp. LCG006 TaxID=3231911 RepID=UPI003460ED33